FDAAPALLEIDFDAGLLDTGVEAFSTAGLASGGARFAAGFVDFLAGALPAGLSDVSGSAARAASASSNAVGYRSSGSLAIPRPITASKPSGTSADTFDGRGRSPVKCPASCCSRLSPGYGRSP